MIVGEAGAEKKAALRRSGFFYAFKRLKRALPRRWAHLAAAINVRNLIGTDM
jgi:hypothetical protein